MTHTIHLTDVQLGLILELLRRERRDLPAEIRHTDTTDLRGHLHQRLQHLGRLIAELEDVEHDLARS